MMKDRASCFVLRAVCAAGVVLFGFGSVWAGTTIPASAYIQDGLIAQWDGIENAGVGQHDPNATTWTELKQGNVNFSISGCTVGDDSVTIPKNTKVTTTTSVFPSDTPNAHAGTYECYWATPDISTGASSYPAVVMLISDMSFLYRVDKNLFQGTARMEDGKFYRHNFSYTATEQRAFHTVSYATMGTTTADNAFYIDGASRSGTVSGNGETMTQSSRTGLVHHDTAGYPVIYKSARIYDRQLTAAEVALNAAVDKIRFEGADPAAVLPKGYRWNAETEKIELRVSVALKGAGGTVSVAGGGNEAWVEPGATVPITVTTPEGTSVVLWRGGTPTETDAGAYSVKAEVPVALTASVGKRLCTWTGAAGDGLWATDGNWDTGSAPAAGECVLIGEGAEVTLSGETPRLASLTLEGAGTKLTMKESVRCAPENLATVLKADAVDILDGAVLTHVINSMKLTEFTAAGEWQMDGRVNVECRDFFVDAASKVSGEGMGFYMNGVNRCHGPACGGITSFASSGAYGAPSCGATVSTLTGGVLTPYGDEYGDPRAPVWAGSSAGGGDNATEKCAGGGAIRIIASGRVLIDGTVTVDAQASSGASRNAGAGGSVWIECLTVAGSGLVTADGTINGGQNDRGGSGGRIAIKYDPAAQRTAGVPTGLRISCNSKSTATRFSSGLPGTVYLPDAQFLGETFSTAGGVSAGRLVLDDWTGWSPTRLTLTNARIWLPSAVCADCTLSSLTVDGFAAQLIVGGEEHFIIARSALTYVSAEQPNITVTGDMNLLNGGKLRLVPAATNGVDATEWATLDVKGNVSLSANSSLALYGHSLNGASCRVYANNMTVAKGATVTADSQGYSGGTNAVSMRAFGPGACLAGGAGHGGHGNVSGSYGWGRAYGSLTAPTLPGSGGGTGDSNQNGSRGGGVVWLTLTGDLVLDGTLTANGQGNLGASSGTGSGGSVYVTCRTLQGTTGKITANGGDGQSNQAGKCGAGGRIAVVYDTVAQAALAAQPTVAFSAYSYCGGTTLYDVNQGFGTLYLPDARFVPEAFSPANMAHVSICCGDWSLWQPENLSVTNGYVRFIGYGAFDLGSISVYKGGRLDIGGDAAWDHYYDGRNIYQSARGIDVTVRGGVTIGNGGQIRLYGGTTNGNAGVVGVDENAALSGRFDVRGDITIATNGWLHAYSHPVEGGSYRITCRKADIALGGGITANNRGWSGLGTTSSSVREELGLTGSGREGYGPGKGRAAGNGGGYGGMGGGSNGGLTYGNWRRPALPGSGAGAGNSMTAASGAGGGLIWLDARKEVDLKGTISADGQKGGGTYGSGGSGGGIYLKTPELKVGEGSVISAQGGGCNAADGARGGGGRIAIWANNYAEVAAATNTGVLAISVLPGQTGKATYGKEGTVFMRRYPGGILVFVR